MPTRALALLFAVSGSLVLLASLASLGSAWRFGQTAAVAEGTVIALNAGGSHPEVAFTTAAGEAVHYPQNGLVAGYRVGDAVRVLYDPSDPRHAVVDAVGARYGFAALGALLGSVFLVVAWVARRTRSTPEHAAPDNA